MTRRAELRAVEFGAPVLLVALWWVVSEAAPRSLYFPPLRDIWAAFRANWLFAGVGTDVVPTLTGIGLGYAVSVVAGIAIGVALGSLPALHDFLHPLIDFCRSLPSSAAVPIFILLVGVGMEMKVAVVTFAALWTVILNTSEAVAGVDPVVTDTSRSYRIGRLDRLLFVTIPAASPQIVVGMRVALNQSIILIIVAEIMVSTHGIGFFLKNAQWHFDLTGMWSGLLLVGVVGYALSRLFLLFESRVLAWHRGLHGKAQP
jgi:ABC-type nitrate/sulfonate/bicarbonate transport system permease component